MTKIELFDFQKNILNKSKSFKNCAFYLDMGLGKTFVGSERLFYEDKNINLVVCQSSKIKDWIDHLETYYDFDVYNLRKKKKLDEFLIECKNSNLDEFYPLVGVINYELAWRRPELINTLEDFTLLLDESSIVQNPKSKLTKCQLELNRYKNNLVLLSGTPTDGKYERLWTQLHMLGLNMSEWQFKNRFCNYKIEQRGKYHYPVLNPKNPYKNVEELKRVMKSLGVFFMKTNEVTSLPKQTFIVMKIAQDAKYMKFTKDWVVETKEKDFVGDTQLTKILYSRMLCGSYNRHKIDTVKDLINSTGDRLVVFYNFKDEYENLEKICIASHRPISYINGSGVDLDAYNNFDNSITLVQYQAGSMGHNLQKCNKIIYFTLPQKSEYFEQSKKRIHRIGQTKPCFYYILQTQKSFEVNMLKTLKKRKNYTDKLFNHDLIN